jgi:hypothetical protein
LSRTRLLVALLVLVPVGFLTKEYSGPGRHFVNGYLGGVLYVVFWVWVVLLLRPRLRPARVAAAVLVITCLLEAAQLWHPPFLEAIRSTLVGRTLIGTTFSWGDFPCYVAGALLSVVPVAHRPAHRPSRRSA